MSLQKIFWNGFEQQVKKEILLALPVKNNFLHGHFLLAVSGGADSVALLRCLHRLKSWHQSKISVLHVHHGNEESGFRDQAAQFTEQLCALHEIDFYQTKYEGEPLLSEEALRNFRRESYFQFQKKLNADLIFTAHHAEDLLETRLLRLMRGSGAQGLQAMSLWQPPLCRPFLWVSRAQIITYLRKDLAQAWCQDPTNSSQKYLRNWVREAWLPELEKRSPGAVGALARSLDLISASVHNEKLPPDLWLGPGIDHVVWQTLTAFQQRQALAQYLLMLGAKDFRQTQIEEICKHLDKSDREHTFTQIGFVWVVNAKQISASSAGKWP